MISPKGCILCIEDDADTRELIAFILTSEGFDVTCTESTDDAICLAKTHHFDLYIVDSWMHALSGPGLTRRLREFDVKTPILFYSGAATESDKENARLAGAQGYLVKPVANEDLIAEVHRRIDESQVESLKSAARASRI